MDLKVHRAMLYLAVERAQTRIEQEGKKAVVDLRKHFWALHQGNWLTDMNQATAFFDSFEGRRDPYQVIDLKKGSYALPKTVIERSGPWTKLFRALWQYECQYSGIDLLPPGSGSSAPLNEQIIGGYYPYDHFDVVDSLDAQGHTISREPAEFEVAKQHRMILTAREGLFKYCKWYWCNPAFTKTSRADTFALRSIGHATHILQDFFSHSNFVEILLTLAAKDNLLDPALADVLREERFGTFASYYIPDPNAPEKTPLMTGRFDRIDTIATVLKIYREGLVPRWNDLAAGGYGGKPGTTRDLVFEVMFGTFSTNPFTAQAMKTIMALAEVRDAIEGLKDAVVKGVIGMFAALGKLFTDKEAHASIDEVKGLLLAANNQEAADFAKAGRILYLEYVIERKLRNDLAAAKGPLLPHHTLLAKDKDTGHPEVRLAYKLACVLAVEVTTELLYHFAIGSDMNAVDDVLHRYYRHPADFLAESGTRDRMRLLTDALYGQRWWSFARTHEFKVVQ